MSTSWHERKIKEVGDEVRQFITERCANANGFNEIQMKLYYLRTSVFEYNDSSAAIRVWWQINKYAVARVSASFRPDRKDWETFCFIDLPYHAPLLSTTLKRKHIGLMESVRDALKDYLNGQNEDWWVY